MGAQYCGRAKGVARAALRWARLVGGVAAALAMGACAGVTPATADIPDSASPPGAKAPPNPDAATPVTDDQLCTASPPVALPGTFGRAPSAQELAAVEQVEIRGAVTDEAAIRAALGGDSGQPVDPAELGRGIERIWALGHYQDVKVVLVTGAEARSILRVELQPRRPTGRVVLRGVSHLSQESAVGALDLRPGELFDPQRVWRGRQRLAELYQQSGFRAVQIESHVWQDDAAHLCVRVTEGVRSTIRSWSFAGASQLDEATLAVITDRRGGINSRGGVYRPDVWALDALRINAWYYDHGFPQARVREPVVGQSPDGSLLDIAVQVEEGPVYRIGRIGFAGARRVPGAAYAAAVKSKVGELFSRSKIAEDLERLRTLQREVAPLGAGTDVTPLTDLDPDHGIVNLEFLIE